MRCRPFLALSALVAALALVAGCGASSPAPAAPEAPRGPAPVQRAEAISIPKIGAESSLVVTGLGPDNAIEVPPVEEPGQASYYRYAPVPGQPGPAVVLGHVNGGGRAGVFSKLTTLDEGDRVFVDTDQGRREFEIYKVDITPKVEFPWSEVLAAVPDPELRLITCTGSFVGGELGYDKNAIVYARQVT